MIRREDKRCILCDHKVKDHSLDFNGDLISIDCDRDCPCSRFTSIKDMIDIFPDSKLRT